MEEKIFIQAAKSFERMFHCSLCFHDYTGKLSSGLLKPTHLNPYCTAVKKKDPYYESECILFDQSALQSRLLTECSPFLKKCPAGFAEYVFPLRIEDRLTGVIFAGPFSGRKLSGETALCATEDFSGKLTFQKALPPLPRDQEAFLAFGNMLAAMLSASSAKKHYDPENVKDVIDDFLNRKHSFNIGLENVAELLSMTPARASNRIKKEFGKGFSALLREKRLASACAFLEKTSFSIADTARRSGFRDASYFHRVFHHETGMTPQEYRERHRHSDV